MSDSQSEMPSMALPCLERDFYARPTLDVARDLLGRHLVHEINGERLVGRIVETEAYGGIFDTACHVAKGRTPRNDVMFGPPGHAYIYLIYGIYNMLNIITERDGEPGGVLIRAITPVEGETTMIAHRGGKRGRELANGPGKLTRAMNITLATFNRHDVCTGEKLWVEPGIAVDDAHIIAGPRIGIDYAEPKDRDAPWRLRVDPNFLK
ncbi:DNA-3-methyladenine glycosylase [Phytohalomonas tamaricis]|uniref:DNA-3-methyladenine glycosylase n=1 Tax=Phytohalomonas tamaricis TaxID=2081032 RepID=UPI000D0BA467|nr:DNA-3-methyladenine glycosylase [Phytohalomonas tamaricis]